MEEEKQLESVRDQFPMLPFPYKSNNTLHRIVIISLPESIVHAEWVEPEQVHVDVANIKTRRDPSYSDAIRRGAFCLATHCERSFSSPFALPLARERRGYLNG